MILSILIFQGARYKLSQELVVIFTTQSLRFVKWLTYTRYLFHYDSNIYKLNERIIHINKEK